MRCSFWGGLPGALLLGQLATAAPVPADSVRAPTPPPRLTLGLASATRTTYLQRAPEPADDQGYLGTTLTYQAPRGLLGSLYLNHSYNYRKLGEPFLNFGELMVGWQSVRNSDTYWTVQYTHLFSYGESALVQSSLRNDFGASLTQFFGLVTASLSADVFVGKAHDVVLTAELSHRFQLPAFAHDTLSLEPTLELGAGSQRFYASSLAQTTQVKTRKRGGTTTVTTEPSSPAFSALGYTLSAPLTYEAARYALALTPSYLVPLHVPTGGSSTAFFYFTVGLTRRFW